MRVLRKRVRWADTVIANEDQLRNIVLRLDKIKTDLMALKATIDGDPDAEAEDLTTMAQIENFVNNAKWSDFVVFVNNALNS